MPLDIGVGLLLGVLLSHLSTLGYGLCLGLGVAAGLLPDIDFVWKFITDKHIPNTTHRDTLHYPLLVIPIVGIIGWLIKPEIGLIFVLGSLLHFIHDSIGVGFGIKWLFPFSSRSYLFFYHTGLPTNKDMPRKKIQSWNNKERQDALQKYGDPHWIRHIYFQPHPYGLTEYFVCLIGVVVATVR